MLLSLDISTSCTGWCLFNQDELCDHGFIKLSKHKGLFEKANRIKSELLLIAQKHHITEVVVEENMQAFRPGLSSAKTLMTLSQFNGVVRWICHSDMSVPVKSFNVNSARKIVGIKLDRKSDVTTKDQILHWVLNNNANIDLPTRLVTRGKHAGKVRPCDESYDMADAYVIGRAHLIEKLKKIE